MSPTLAIPQTYNYFPHFTPLVRPRVLAGLGGTLTPAQLTQQIGGITGAAATGALSALQLANVIALGAGVIPLIGAGIAAVTAIVAVILNSGCGQTCIITSNWANQAEQALIQNIQEYFALPTPRSLSAQAVALANFDNVWNYLVKECGQLALGTAGIDCTKDRMRGACKWNQTTTSPLLQYPGEPQPGQCWNWFNGYRDPIANDQNVAPDSVAAPAGSASVLGTMDWSTAALYGGIALLAIGLIGGLN